MRAFCLFAVVLASCATEDGPAPPPGGSGDPGILGTGTQSVGGTGSGGVDGQGGVGGDGSLDAVCVNADDIAALDASEGGREVAINCLNFRFPTCADDILDPDRYEGCVSLCVTELIEGLSDPCGRCFGRASRCELDNACTTACRTNLCGQTCQTCSAAAGCLDELEACTGLNDSSCPEVPTTTAP